MGRPKSPIETLRTVAPPLRIRLSESEREELDKAASPSPTSTWAREVLLA